MTLPRNIIGKKDEKECVTFEEAMEIVGTGYFQIRLAIIGGIVLMSSYFAVGVITFVLPVAHCDLHIDYEDRGNLASVSFIGLIISCHTWGFLSDTLGRRYILIRCLFCDALLYVLTMIFPNFYVILFLRLLNGVASCGGVVSIYAYIGEFQTDKFRSRSIMIASFIAASAYTILPCLAWFIIPAKWEFVLYPGLTVKSWRLFYVACGIPSLVSAILLYFLPESPKFLLAKRKTKQALKILEKMYKVNHKGSDNFPVKNLKVNDEDSIRKLDDNRNKVVAVFQLVWHQTVPLLKKPYRFNFALLCLALFICYFCNNGLYVWLPEAINRLDLYRNLTGSNEGSYCDVLNCDKKYEIKGTAVEKKLLLSRTRINLITRKLLSVEETICHEDVDTSVYFDYMLFGIISLVIWVIITAIIKYVNKKYLMLLMTTCTLFAAISMKLSNALILMPIKAGAILVLISGIFPILNSVVVDLFPTRLRAMAGCLTLMASRLGTVATHEITGFLIDSHCNVLIWNYIILTAVCFLSISLLPSSPPRPSSNSSSTENINEERRIEQV